MRLAHPSQPCVVRYIDHEVRSLGLGSYVTEYQSHDILKMTFYSLDNYDYISLVSIASACGDI